MSRTTVTLRLCIGLLQGLLLYFLYYVLQAKLWPATNPWVFGPLVAIVSVVPVLMVQGMGNIRWKTLLIWGVGAALLLWGLTFYDLWRRSTLDVLHGAPSGQLVGLSITLFFIAHALITASDIDRRFMARYPTYFDVAWKLGVQLVLSSMFLGIFWGLLELGAALFNFIGFKFLDTLIAKSWFAIPATALVFNAALHVTDVRANLVRGIRTLALTLLSWLLPLLTLILAGFLIALVVSGLKPLTQSNPIMCILLVSVELIIILINAVYKEGEHETILPRILRYSGTVAALILLPVTALSIYALSIRIAKEGWTIDWIFVAAYLFIVTVYALCYAFAAIKRGPWLKFIEVANFAIALLILAVIIALLTPIADPARLSVPSQLARNNFTYLRWEGERFGQAALERAKQMVQGPQSEADRLRIEAALAAKSQASEVGITKNLSMTVHTPDGRLPDSFMQQKWSDVKNLGEIPRCILYGTLKCDAWLKDLNGDQHNEIIILERYTLTGFSQNPQGVWVVLGTWPLYNSCKQTQDAAQAGQFQPVPPEPQRWPDFQVGGERLRYSPPYQSPQCQ